MKAKPCKGCGMSTYRDLYCDGCILNCLSKVAATKMSPDEIRRRDGMGLQRRRDNSKGEALAREFKKYGVNRDDSRD